MFDIKQNKINVTTEWKWVKNQQFKRVRRNQMLEELH